ncbi:MAG: hypothetical protein DRN68_03955 [Thaumarchaeota archaeon]|nr:MAG: hypothetical protein DRN68_03955 [Nitrososphaerota archaeon]
MSRLKVLFITSWYPTKEQPVGGIFVREHAKAVKLYDDVVILHCAGEDNRIKGLWRFEEEADLLLTEGIPTYRVWYRPCLPKGNILIYIYSVFQAFRYIVRQGFRPDIIHAHIYEAGLPAVIVGKLYNLPVMITEHWSGFPRKALSIKDILIARLAFQNAHRVFPVSKVLQKGIEAYGIRANFQIIPNVVNTELFWPYQKPRNRFKKLLLVALLTPIKGVPYLLQALAQLRGKHDSWHLDIVGDGPARAEYEQMAIKLGIADKVTFHGLKPKREVAEFMRKADLFVLPSLYETFGCVLIEAMASGIPVIATSCGGPEDIVKKEVGIIVPPRDISALAGAIEKMLDSSDSYKPERIRKYVEETFSPEAVGQQLHKLYLKTVRLNET